jgi:hypothetical protein
MSRILTPDDLRKLQHAAQHGGSVPDGPVIPCFDPRALAEAIEQEVARSRILGWGKISLHFDVEDAAEFARWLKKRRTGH